MGKQIEYLPRASINSATFTGSYQALGSPITHAGTIIKIVNNSTVAVDVSVDGVNDHDIVPGMSFTLYDYTANSPFTDDPSYRKLGTQYYVKGSSGTGSVYLVVQYIVNL